MSLIKDVKELLKKVNEIHHVLVAEDEHSVVEKECSVIEKEYKEYKFFADSRGIAMLSQAGLIDDYNAYMSELEALLFSDVQPYKVELPKPSDKLKKFKDRFNKVV